MNYKEYIVDYISEKLSDEKKREFEAFLNENPEVKKEFNEDKRFWDALLTDTPEPSNTMDNSFYAMLHSLESKPKKESVFDQLSVLFTSKLLKRAVYGLAILTLGFFLGKGFQNTTNSSEEIIKTAQKETETVRSQLVLTLLEQPSANKRLQAVNEVNKLNTVTETIIMALFSTLNNDESVNVRLSAVEALKKYTDIPMVREGLIKSIVNQHSPIVQMELADLMVLLQEKKAVKSFEKLIEKEDVNANAKEKMEESIKSII